VAPPPSLDLCINDLFEPGNIPADPGIPPSVPDLLTPSLDFSKSTNSMYFLLLIW